MRSTQSHQFAMQERRLLGDSGRAGRSRATSCDVDKRLVRCSMLPTPVDTSEVLRGIRAFNSRYAEMERALWFLATKVREDLLVGVRQDVAEAFVWTIKSWWAVQGVRRETGAVAVKTLRALKWDDGVLDQGVQCLQGGEELAVRIVSDLVEGMRLRGVTRCEWSLASKVLHWLLPWRIPVYDGYVKRTLGIPEGRAHSVAYKEIVRWEFEVARQLMTEGSDWFGDTEPRAPFRALDKYLWWHGGGNTQRSVLVRDPWDVVRRLSLTGV